MNGKKTKIMVFRKIGKRKGEKWWYRREEIEVVNEYKYLGYCFMIKRIHGLHIKKNGK